MKNIFKLKGVLFVFLLCILSVNNGYGQYEEEEEEEEKCIYCDTFGNELEIDTSYIILDENGEYTGIGVYAGNGIFIMTLDTVYLNVEPEDTGSSGDTGLFGNPGDTGSPPGDTGNPGDTGLFGNPGDTGDTGLFGNPEGTEDIGNPEGTENPEGDEECKEEDKQTWYKDGDSDGFGDDNVIRRECTQPSGYVSKGGDCDDTKKMIWSNCATYTVYKDEDSDGWYAEKKTGVYKDQAGGATYFTLSGDTKTVLEGKWNTTSSKGEDCDDGNNKVWEANKTFKDFNVYEDSRQPGQESDGSDARDYHEGDITMDEFIDLVHDHFDPKSRSQGPIGARIIREVNELSELSDNDLFNEMFDSANTVLRFQEFLGTGLGDSSFDDNLQANIDMINRFRQDANGIVDTSGNIDSSLRNDSGYQSFVNNLKNEIITKIESINRADEIESISFETHSRPTFGVGANRFNWNSSWTVNMQFTNVKLDCTNFSGNLVVDVYDQFGLDDADMFTSPFSQKARQLDGFWAWYVAQRIERPGRNNYAPFINHFNDNINISATVN